MQNNRRLANTQKTLTSKPNNRRVTNKTRYRSIQQMSHHLNPFLILSPEPNRNHLLPNWFTVIQPKHIQRNSSHQPLSLTQPRITHILRHRLLMTFRSLLDQSQQFMRQTHPKLTNQNQPPTTIVTCPPINRIPTNEIQQLNTNIYRQPHFLNLNLSVSVRSEGSPWLNLNTNTSFYVAFLGVPVTREDTCSRT